VSRPTRSGKLEKRGELGKESVLAAVPLIVVVYA
jgi:hypothetical protein